MSQAVALNSPDRAAGTQVTLRTLIDRRRSAGSRFHLAEVVAIVVPICTELANLHARGVTVYVHPSSVGARADGTPCILVDVAANYPMEERDVAAVAPELAAGATTNARSSVFSVAALVYEMLTLRPVGPQMELPTKVVSALPPMVDSILARALVRDPAERPDDLPALAQAIHHFAPNSIAPPPEADDRAFEVDVDLHSSMLPPVAVNVTAPAIPKAAAAPAIASDDPFAAVDLRSPQKPAITKAVEELAVLKARLEADPSPRWMVVKDRMDHGPFAALELLQQIASHTFRPEDTLVDMNSDARVLIKDHPEFSRFAHHAHLHREEVKEKKAVAKAERREKAAGATKLTVGIIVVVSLLAAVVFVAYSINRAMQADEQRKRAENNLSIAGEGNVAGKKSDRPKAATGGGGGGGGGGSYGGKSYEEAMRSSVSGQDDDMLSQKECAGPVGGDIAASCGLNGSATAKIWVQRGRASGVTVTTDPSQPGVNSCMAARIAGLGWRNVPGGTGCIRTFKVVQ